MTREELIARLEQLDAHNREHGTPPAHRVCALLPDILAALRDDGWRQMADPPTDFPVLHIHAQYSWHDEATIVGNLPALRALLHTIQMAIAHSEHDMEAFCADGEGYPVTVRVLDAPFDDPAWKRERLPYTAREARESTDADPR